MSRRIGGGKSSSSFFRGWWSFTKRKEMIGPYLSYFVQDRIVNEVIGEMMRRSVSAENIQIVKSHLIGDIYNMYYTPSKDQEYVSIDDDNRGKWELLRMVNDSSLKVITNNNSYVSKMFTIEICYALIEAVSAYGQSYSEAFKDGLSNTPERSLDSEEEGDGNGNQEKGNGNKGRRGQEFHNTIQVASSVIESRVAAAKRTVLAKLAKLEEVGFNIGDLEGQGIGDIHRLMTECESLLVAGDSLKPIVNRIVDRSRSYFSNNSTSTEVSILESDTINGIEGLENLIGIFRRISFGEITTKERKYKGKLNVYVDISGSMNEEVNINGKFVSKIVFAKSIAKKLHELGVIDTLLTFTNSIIGVYEDPSLSRILLMSAGGGTSIDTVIADINNRGVNGLVITDCESTICKYSEKAFIIGTPGARIRPLADGEAFKGNGQVWIFNGDRDIVSI